jgi:hypothetical protein
LAAHSGVVQANAYRDPPPGFAIRVGVFDDSDLNLSIKARLEDALKKHGHLVDDSGQLRLMLESETVNNERTRVERSFGRGTIEGAGDSAYGAWQDPESQIFRGYEREIVTGYDSYFHIHAVLRDPDDNRIIWEGDAFAHLGNQRPQSVAPALAEELGAAFGKSVARREFAF